MRPIRIACVRYLNTAPLIQGLEKLAGCELIPTVPSRIAGLVQRGEADIGLVSLIDVARPGGVGGSVLALIPTGMIGCDGPTLTVRVFSRVPLERVVELHADTDSHTSVVLCRLLLKRVYGVSPRVVEWEAGKSGKWKVESGNRNHPTAIPDFHFPLSTFHFPETLLLIGDKVVTDAPPATQYPHQLDLGEAWKTLTGLPFVYAMWMCRADRAGEDLIRRGAALLDRQRRHNRTRVDWIVSESAPDHRWPEGLAAKYLGSLLRFEVGAREREAVERFLAMAAEDGLAERAPLKWVEPEPVGAA